jgi:predicted CoA-binding protein
MKTVAVIGASNDRSRYGNMAVRAFRRAGYEVFPVNPTEPTIEGLKAYPAVSEVPAELDTVTIYVRPALLVKLLPQIAAKGCKDLWLNPGTSSSAVLTEVNRLGLNAIEGCSILAIGQSPYAAD